MNDPSFEFVSTYEIAAKAEEVRKKAYEKWLETEAGIGVAANKDAFLALDDGTPFREVVVELEKFTQRDPSRLNTISQQIFASYQTMSTPYASRLSAVGDDVKAWRGIAADDFRNRFLMTFPDINDNQVAWLRALDVSVVRLRDALAATRKDTLDIAQSTYDALDAVESSDNSLSVALGIVSALSGAASAIPAVGTAFAVTSALTGIASQLTSNTNVGGATVGEVLTSMMDSLAEVRQNLETIETALADGLRRDLETVNAELSNSASYAPPLTAGYDPLFVPYRPRVADVTATELDKFKVPTRVSLATS